MRDAILRPIPTMLAELGEKESQRCRVLRKRLQGDRVNLDFAVRECERLRNAVKPQGYDPKHYAAYVAQTCERVKFLRDRIRRFEDELRAECIRASSRPVSGLGQDLQVPAQDCEAIKVEMQRQLRLAKTRSQEAHRKRAAAAAARLKTEYETCIATFAPPLPLRPGLPPGAPDAIVTPDGVFEMPPPERQIFGLSVKTLGLFAVAGVAAYFLFLRPKPKGS